MTTSTGKKIVLTIAMKVTEKLKALLVEINEPGQAGELIRSISSSFILTEGSFPYNAETFKALFQESSTQSRLEVSHRHTDVPKIGGTYDLALLRVTFDNLAIEQDEEYVLIDHDYTTAVETMLVIAAFPLTILPWIDSDGSKKAFQFGVSKVAFMKGHSIDSILAIFPALFNGSSDVRKAHSAYKDILGAKDVGSTLNAIFDEAVKRTYSNMEVTIAQSPKTKQ